MVVLIILMSERLIFTCSAMVFCLALTIEDFPAGFIFKGAEPRCIPLVSPCPVSVQTPQTPAALSCSRAECELHPTSHCAGLSFSYCTLGVLAGRGLGALFHYSVQRDRVLCSRKARGERERELETTQVPVCPLTVPGRHDYL